MCDRSLGRSDKRNTRASKIAATNNRSEPSESEVESRMSRRTQQRKKEPDSRASQNGISYQYKLKNECIS